VATSPDPIGTATDPLSLTEAIDVAFRNHADVAIAGENLQVARERVTQAKTGTLPQVSAALTYQLRGVSDLAGVFGEGRNEIVTDNGLQPAVRARATLFDQNQTKLRVQQARSGVVSSEAGVLNVQRLLRFDVTSNYIELLRAQQQLLLVEEQVRLAQAQLDLIDARIAVGDAATSDRFPLVRELRRAQERRVSALNNVNVNATRLRNSMGLPAGPPPVVEDLPQPASFEVPGADQSVALAEQRRPDLQQNIAAVEVSRRSVSLARIQRRPLFTTVVEANLTPKDEFTRGNYLFALGWTMPIWDAGLTKSQQREAESGLDSDRARLDQTRKDIAAEVQAAHLNLASARERLEASQASVEAAQVALDAANARYQQGLATTIDLTDAQVGFILARNDAINALYDYYLSLAQLQRAVGQYP
jgi:outer membrane protein TolC